MTGERAIPAARSVGRRRFLLGLSATLAHPVTAVAIRYPDVVPGTPLRFPRDHGAHPDFRTEWWYLTGWLYTDRREPLGAQLTFFRTRPGLQEDNPSRFAPTQLLFAHAALADPRQGRLQYGQRAARSGFGLAAADERTTAVHIDDWSLDLREHVYRAQVVTETFAFDLACAAHEAPLLEGSGGYSRKGPDSASASYYYSRPHLGVNGVLERSGERTRVRGEAWLDHEWASEILPPSATGWDWAGINLEDGGALMAFRIRDDAGQALWAGGTHVDARGVRRTLGAHDVAFTPTRWWASPRTGIRYPVQVRVRAGRFTFETVPLMDDQELDARASVGTVYWEGAVRAISAGRVAGHGYLELTGYGGRPRL
ncbi:MAG: carotenoid 1,2-hydratase [Betaproteobacteria bacterium]|nr:carotenoid 1,2-hydratase [Betaproteobacteria bacterium]